MRLGWLAVPAVLLFSACSDPAASYRKAAHQLTFTLDRVDPTIQWVYPIEQSRLVLHLTVGANNPTDVRFKARSISGRITLESDGATYAIGELSALQGVDLKPMSRTPVAMGLAITYADLKQAWGSLRMVSQGARPGTWKLDGQVGLEVLGFPVTAPLHVQKRASGQ